MSSVN